MTIIFYEDDVVFCKDLIETHQSIFECFDFDPNSLKNTDVLIFKYKDKQILLKNANETYSEAYHNSKNEINDEWLKILYGKK